MRKDSDKTKYAKKIKNVEKIKEAAALKYSPEKDEAPVIVAQGRGVAAEKILETAGKSNVPVYKDAALVRTLNSFQIGDEIPPALYGIIAEILAFVGSMDKKYGEKSGAENR